MFCRKVTSVLLVSSIFAAMQAGPVYAGTIDKSAGVNLVNSVKYETQVDFESEKNKQKSLTDTLEETDEAKEAGLEKSLNAANAAEEAADAAQGCADETEGREIADAAEEAAAHAENARAAADLACGANDSRTVEMAAEIARTAQAAAEEAAAKAETAAEAEIAEAEAEAERAAAEAAAAAEAEAAAREAEMLASAEYLGNFTLTAYCNCASCCGTAGNATASGVMPTSGHTVAMGGIDFGTKLLINGTVYTVEDRGTPYGHVDIYFDTHEEALQFGMSSADVYLVHE